MKRFLFAVSILLFFCISCTPKYTDHSTTYRVKPFEPCVNEGIFLMENGQWIKGEPDQKPQPIGGEDNYLRTLYGKIKYPAMARENGIQGCSVIAIVVNEFGQQESAEIKKRIGNGCDEEALAAVIRAGQLGFEPVMKNGKAVKVKYDVPVKFKLE